MDFTNIEPAFIQILSVIFGLFIGSFLTVCIHRLPHGRDEGPPEDLSIDGLNQADQEEQERLEKQRAEEEKLGINSPPRSFCPHCNKQLYWWHNIPVLSWFLLGGKCFFCKTPIPLLYPFVESLSAFTCFLSFSFFDLQTAAVVYIFCCALIVISFIDIKYYIIPNVITFSGMIIGLALATCNHFFHIFSHPVAEDLLDSVLGFVFGAGFLFFVSEVYLRLRGKMGLGMGDVKLLGMTGLCFGASCSLFTIFVGSVIGTIIGGGLLLIGGQKFAKPLPFGPYLALGTAIYLFYEALHPGGMPRLFEF